jgi:hypothetical protein
VSSQQRTATIFDHQIRILLCRNCGAPLPAPAGGGSVTCEYCRATTQLAPRRDVPIPKPPEPPLSEPERMDRLRQQDGKRLSPPGMAWALMTWNGDNKPKVAERALAAWNKARSEIETGGEASTEQAEARLYFLTLCFSNYYSERRETERVRAMIETAHEMCEQPRHKQVLLGMMARHAAREGDIESAEEWLADLDPRSADIYMDTSWRYARAFLDTLRGDYHKVLEVLGSTFDDVPIADAFDYTCAVYRANAHERLGDVESAKRELLVAMDRTPSSPRVMFEIVKNQPELELVPRSLQAAVGPRLRRWKVRHRLYQVAWLGTSGLLAVQWLLTRFADASLSEALAPLRLFSVPSIWPAIAVLGLGVVLHWRWKP